MDKSNQLGVGGKAGSGGTIGNPMAAAALAAILAEWGSTDSYATRIANLMGTLNPSTVHDNGMADNLYGGPGMDWYFAGMADILFNHTSGEVITSV